MKQNQKKRKRIPAGRVALALGLLGALAVLAVLLLPASRDGDAGGSGGQSALSDDAAASSDSGAELTEESIFTTPVTFPLALEDGRLLLENLFRFDGLNPDCGNGSGSDIATITLTNQSDVCLSRAELTLLLDDGRRLHFVVSDLPAGKSVMAFATDNAAIDSETTCVEATCQATFDAEASLLTDRLGISVTGTHIAVENRSASDLTELVISCHGTLGDQYFGGIAYTYQIDSLPAGETAELDAVDCVLGLAEVVRIRTNEP